VPSRPAAVAAAGVEFETGSVGPVGPAGLSRRAVCPMWPALPLLGDQDLGSENMPRQNPVVAPWAR
jgi:hypothetical protein